MLTFSRKIKFSNVCHLFQFFFIKKLNVVLIAIIIAISKMIVK